MLSKLPKRQKTITGSRNSQLSVGEKVTNKKSGRQRKLFNFKLSNGRSMIGLVVIFALAVGLGNYYYFNKPKVPDANRENDLLQADESDQGKVEIVKKFGTDYDRATKELSSKSPAEWDKASLENAYLSLLYADKVGAFTQVYTMLSLIDSARKNGVDIDDNSYGINQQKRDDIRQRADIKSQETLSNRAGDTGE